MNIIAPLDKVGKYGYTNSVAVQTGSYKSFLGSLEAESALYNFSIISLALPTEFIYPIALSISGC